MQITCDRCGEVMRLDKAGDMWLCGNMMCGFLAPTQPPTPPTEPLVGKISLGTGVLSWLHGERVTDRYGAVILLHPGDKTTSVLSDRVQDLVGLVGTLRCEVVDTRTSHHIGDVLRGLSPTRPTRGDQFVLGFGTLFTEQALTYTTVGLNPGNRATDWLDPVALYQVHEQTVHLVFTTEGT